MLTTEQIAELRDYYKDAADHAIAVATKAMQAAYTIGLRAGMERAASVCDQRADWHWTKDGVHIRHADGTDYGTAIRAELEKL